MANQEGGIYDSNKTLYNYLEGTTSNEQHVLFNHDRLPMRRPKVMT